jgi:hypothetical protein
MLEDLSLFQTLHLQMSRRQKILALNLFQNVEKIKESMFLNVVLSVQLGKFAK